MTKVEVWKAIRNHSGDIRTILVGLDAQLASVVKGVYAQPDGFINELKASLDAAESQVQEIKDLLDQWPE